MVQNSHVIGTKGGSAMGPDAQSTEHGRGQVLAISTIGFALTLVATVRMHVHAVKLLHTASPGLANKFEHDQAGPTDVPPVTALRRKAGATT